MVPLPLLCPQDVIYEEEISHVAAGVRYLTHLHAVAHSWSGQPQAGSAQLGECQPGDPQLREADLQPEQQQPEQEAEQSRLPQQQADQAQQQVQQAQQEQAEVPAWVAEARQHATVQAWFHSLVRCHFFGSLKPPFNEEARARAGFLPDFYEPLAADAAPAKPAAAAAGGEKAG